MSSIAAALVPLILLIGLGFALARTGFLSDATKQGINRLIFWVGLPGLILHELVQSQVAVGEADEIFLALLFATMIGMLAGYPLARVLKLSWAETGTFVQGIFRGNLALLGIPVFLHWKGDPAPELTATAFMVLAPAMIMYNVLAVIVLTLSQGSGSFGSVFLQAVRDLVTNPIIVSSVAGVVLALNGFLWPEPIEIFLGMTGAMTIPLALIGVGAALVTQEKARRQVPPIAATIGKLLLVPLVAWPLGEFFQLSRDGMSLLLIFAACPTAAVSYIMAAQLGGNPRMASTIIVYTTTFSMVTLAILLYFLG